MTIKSLIIPLVVFGVAVFSVAAIVDREERRVETNYPEVEVTPTPESPAVGAEAAVAGYIRAAHDNNEKALLGYIADLATLPHRQPGYHSEPMPHTTGPDNSSIKIVGTDEALLDELGHQLLPRDEIVLLRDEFVDRMESKCSSQSRCQVRVFFKDGVAHDFIVYYIRDDGWKIVSVLSSLASDDPPY